MPTTVTVIPSGTYQSQGPVESAATSVPLGVSSATLAIDRTNWSDPSMVNTSFDVQGEISMDAGVTWDLLPGFHTIGGPGFNRGVPVTVSQQTWQLGNPTNAQRQVRMRTTIVGPIHISGTLTLN